MGDANFWNEKILSIIRAIRQPFNYQDNFVSHSQETIVLAKTKHILD